MKQIKIFVSVLAAILFVSCDHIAEDERYVEVDAIEAQRVVLLEEFTGQNCPNCPKAHEAIEALQQQYGASIIPVSIHAGSFGIAEGEYGEYFQTFKTSEGDQYASQWGIKAYPSGLVNRNGDVTLHTEWANLVRQELARPTTLDIQLNAHLNGDMLVAGAVLRSSEPLSGKLQLWVLEDSIVSIQLDGANMITDYVHNNVYRASLNGVGGQPVSLQANVYEVVTATIPMHDEWNPRNLSVVGFVYDDKGVTQAARVGIDLPVE